MKLYLAAPYAGRDILKDQLPLWQDAGHEITCGWVKGTRPLGADSFGISAVSTDDEVSAHAQMDLADIDDADVLVHYTAGFFSQWWTVDEAREKNLYSGGRHVETGYAIAKEIPVLVLGEFENIFQRGLCMQAYDIPAALAVLSMLGNIRLYDNQS